MPGQRRDSDSIAIIEDPATKTQAVYRTGDPLPGGDAEVAEILPRAVTIRRAGQLEILGFPLASAEAPASTASSAPPVAGGQGDEIRQMGPGRYVLGSRMVENTSM